MVFYRKYRPQKLQELDSERVRETLFAALNKKEIAHAYLFTGPKGLGKTSSARIVAKIVNCQKRKSIEPCNKCEQCISITKGNNLDVLEIDGASNRGIDEVRELREAVKLAPAAARNKFYIIDEAHMMTREAFNALLKTLEEPPAHVIFILCTTELEKVPETIASRCFLVNFTKASLEELTRSIGRIIKAEKIKISPDAVRKIAKLGDGSFRDAAKILEQLVGVFNRKKITSEMVDREYKSGSRGQLQELIFEKDTKEALLLLEKLVNQGASPKLIIEELLGSIHSILLAKLGIVELQEKLYSELSIDELKKLMEILNRASYETKTSVIPQLPLELAIIEWGQAQDHLGGGRMDSPEVNNLLELLIQKVKPLNHSIAGVLRSCSAKVDGKKVIIEARYKFHKERLEEEKTSELIGMVASQVTGKPMRVDVILKGGD